MMDLIMNRSINRRSHAIQKKYWFGYKMNTFKSFRPYTPSAIRRIYLNGRMIKADYFQENDGSMAILMQLLVFCNENTNQDKIHGKTDLEKSLLDFAASKGFHKKLFDKIVPKIAKVRIDGEPRTASTIIGLNGRYRVVVKDKPEKLLSRCDKFLFKGKTIPLTMNMIARVKNVHQQMAISNLQVIMLAFKDLERLPVQLDPVFQTSGLTLVGMIGLQDSVSNNLGTVPYPNQSNVYKVRGEKNHG